MKLKVYNNQTKLKIFVSREILSKINKYFLIKKKFIKYHPSNVYYQRSNLSIVNFS